MTFEEFQKIEHRHSIDERCSYATRLRTLGDIEKYSACYANAHRDRAALIAEVKQLRAETARQAEDFQTTSDRIEALERRNHQLTRERDARICAADLLPRVLYK